MKAKKIIIVIFLCLCCTICYIPNMGISLRSLEADARKQHDIPDTWISYMDHTDKIACILFFDPTSEKNLLSVYLNHPGLSIGYYFDMSISRDSPDTIPQKFIFDGYGSILISTNSMKLNRLQIGNSLLSLNTKEPFVFCLNKAHENLFLYDQNNNCVIPEEFIVK